MTYTGNLPTTITALAKAIHSLTQYGLCTQADTPTPSAPVDIKCNNGALKMVDDELPTGYKRVLGFTCDNNSMWEITGFNLKGSDTVRISFSVTAACNVFGCYQGTDATDNYDLYVSTSAGSKYFRYGSGTYLSAWGDDDLGQRFDVTYTPNGSTGMPVDSTWSPLTFTSENDLLIGATTLTGTSAKMKGNLYGNFEVDGRLKLIPCERVSDNALGYYDTIGETFYAPYEGFDGAVSLGYDGSHYSLATVGTPEVLSVSGAGASILDNTIDGQGMGFNATSTKCIYKSIPVGTLGKYVISVSDGYQAILRRKSGSTGSNVTSWKQTQTYNFTSATTQYCIAIRIGSGVDDLSPETFDGVVKFSPVETQTASVENLYAAGDYKDEHELISGTVTRKCGIVVLKGDEAVGISNACYTVGISDRLQSKVTVVCSHFPYSSKSSSQTDDQTIISFSSTNIGFRYDACADKTAFAAWLKDQYDAGTPVIVIYPLAEEVTESVTGQHLHTCEGDNTVSATAEVSPISVEIVYTGEEVTEP